MLDHHAATSSHPLDDLYNVNSVSRLIELPDALIDANERARPADSGAAVHHPRVDCEIVAPGTAQLNHLDNRLRLVGDAVVGPSVEPEVLDFVLVPGLVLECQRVDVEGRGLCRLGERDAVVAILA